jgi:hypothetical protein
MPYVYGGGGGGAGCKRFPRATRVRVILIGNNKKHFARKRTFAESYIAVCQKLLFSEMWRKVETMLLTSFYHNTQTTHICGLCII